MPREVEGGFHGLAVFQVGDVEEDLGGGAAGGDVETGGGGFDGDVPGAGMAAEKAGDGYWPSSTPRRRDESTMAAMGS